MSVCATGVGGHVTTTCHWSVIGHMGSSQTCTNFFARAPLILSWPWPWSPYSHGYRPALALASDIFKLVYSGPTFSIRAIGLRQKYLLDFFIWGTLFLIRMFMPHSTYSHSETRPIPFIHWISAFKLFERFAKNSYNFKTDKTKERKVW